MQGCGWIIVRINSYIPAMTAARNYGVHANNVSKNIYRLSSGKKLLTDDPAGVIIASKLQARIRELGRMTRAAEYAIDALNTASGEMQGRQSLLQRMREISIQLGNGTLTQDDKSILMAELTELAKEFSDSTFKNTGMQIIAVGNGSISDELMYMKGDLVYNEGRWTKLSELQEKWVKEGKFDINSIEPLEGGVPIEVNTDEGSNEKLITLEPISSITVNMSLTDYIDSLFKGNLMSFASIGAATSALSFRLDRLYAEEENAIAALSRIEDVDMAKEITQFVKNSILCQVALAVAAQANTHPNHILTLLDSADIT
jgi:flagellin